MNNEDDVFLTLKYQRIGQLPNSRLCGTYWVNDQGQLHRLDGPAVEYQNGTLEWYLDGQLHRDRGPAVIYPGGPEMWYQHGQLHRVDGPAVIYKVSRKEWYQHGQLHRVDGPAVIRNDGSETR